MTCITIETCLRALESFVGKVRRDMERDHLAGVSEHLHDMKVLTADMEDIWNRLTKKEEE